MDKSGQEDRAQILKVIDDETAAYFNKDYEAWARCRVHAPYVRRLGWYARGGALIHTGWEQEDAVMKCRPEIFLRLSPERMTIRSRNQP